MGAESIHSDSQPSGSDVLLEEIEKAVFVVGEDVESIKLAFKLVGARPVFPGRFEQDFNPLLILGTEALLSVGFTRELRFFFGATTLLHRGFHFGEEDSQVLISQFRLGSQLGHVELDLGHLGEGSQNTERGFWVRELGEHVRHFTEQADAWDDKVGGGTGEQAIEAANVSIFEGR